MDLMGNVYWDQAKGHWVNRYGQPIKDEFSRLAAEQAISQATKRCEENLNKASQQNWDALSQQMARIAEVDQKLAAEAQMRMESEQATCGGCLAENTILPHEYQEDYRRAGIQMWKTADWSGMFRQVVEELGQRDKAIADFNFFRDRWFQQRQEMIREHDKALGLYKAAVEQLQADNRRLKDLLGKP